MAFRFALLSCLVLAAGYAGAELPPADPPPTVMPARHSALIENHCLQCHDTKTQEGNVDLETLPLDLGTIESAELWHKILGAINSGEMPPQDETQLNASEKTEFLADLSNRLVAARQKLSDQGGVITLRRLNRREYINTIRDLLGVDIDAKDLPNDANAGGFDTAGSSLFLSSDQFEKYLEIGRKAIDTSLAIDPHVEPTVLLHREPEDDANKQVRSRLNRLTKSYKRTQAFRASDQPATKFGFIDESRVVFEENAYHRQSPPFTHYLKMPETKEGVVLVTSFAGAMLDVTKIPDHYPPGEYKLRLRVGAFEESPRKKRFIEYGEKLENAQTGEMSVLGCRSITGTIDQPQIIEIPIQLSSRANRSLTLRSRQQNNRTAAQRVYRAALAQGKPMPDPSVWVDWVELEGPFFPQSTESLRDQLLLGDTKNEDTSGFARKTLADFAGRAFRGKQPSEPYLSRLIDLYRERRDAGEPPEDAIREPLSVILASPSFLYLSEPNDTEARRALSPTELAIRLSYFLWSAPPDETLTRLAANGKLSDPDVLASQTDRLLRSPRSSDFISGFTHQWLTMDRLNFFQFNATRFPEFDDSVKAASREEVYQTIATVLHEDLPIGQLLDSDFVVVNDLLANYYGIEGVQGSEFRKVEVPDGLPRGGLLGTAAVLAMGSDGERSSPVERGAWVLRKLLNDPPPPAPANVPQLSRLEDAVLSARELQKAHQEEPQCAQCHRKIDPIGFGLENFDAAGRWRTMEKLQAPITAKQRRKQGKAKVVSVPIDPTGTMPDGKQFGDFEGLRQEVAQREGDFARGFTESLIAYGLGRPYGFSDHRLAERIIEESTNKNRSIKSFIHALVQSQEFRSK